MPVLAQVVRDVRLPGLEQEVGNESALRAEQDAQQRQHRERTTDDCVHDRYARVAYLD